MNKKTRITDESIANIKVASGAEITKASGGYIVTVSNEYGSATLKDGSGNAVYRTKTAAKRVVHRHNENVEFKEKEQLPSPAMRAPEASS